MARLNYTGRKRINRQDVQITVLDINGVLTFKADVQLDDYRLPPDSPLYIEAYRQTSWMRFECGNAGKPLTGAANRLSEFDSLDGIRFRVKVTEGVGTHGKLLAVADKIPPVKPEEGDGGRLCILPVRSAEMECIWRLELSDTPTLLISKRAGSKDALTRSPEFIALVYPAVLGEILDEIRDTHDEWQEEEDCWQRQWLTFVDLLPGVGDMPEITEDSDNEAFREWKIDAMESFSRCLNIPETYSQYREEEE